MSNRSKFETDDALLKGILDGNPHAYKYLLHIVDTELLPYWRWRFYQLSDEDLKDALLDAVVAFIQKVNAYDAVRPVLFKISRNKIVDLIRRRVFSDKTATIYERFFAEEDWSLLRQIPENDVDTLKERLSTSEKSIFDLLCEGKQEEEIAKELNFSVAIVIKNKSIAKQKLRLFFKEEYEAVHTRFSPVEDWSTLDGLKQLESSITTHQFPYILEEDFNTFKKRLSTSEKSIFDLLCESKQEEEIAEELNLSLATVNNIKSIIKRKLKEFLGLAEKGIR